MRTIAHISDLHFGREDKQIVEGLLESLTEFHPNVIAISGDLTQRAKKSEFEAARVFLQQLPSPYVVVPGNHDIPLYDVIRRSFRPLHRYRDYITHDMSPVFKDDEFLVVGVNTARSATFKNGRISLAQIKDLETKLCAIEIPLFKVVVTHHPFLPPEDEPLATLVGRAELALEVLQHCGVDLLLAGHFHRHYLGDVRAHYKRVKRSILVVQAGTAVSKRLRGEKNSYNRIRIEPQHISIDRYTWDEDRFQLNMTLAYKKINDEWHREESPQLG